MSFKAFLAIVIAVFSLLILVLSIVIVPAGNVGVITNFGAVNRVVYPGLSLKIPIVEGVVIMDVRTTKDQVDAAAASQDLQAVTSTIAVNYHLDPQYAVAVYQSIGTDYADKIISPSIQNVFKGTTAKFTAEQLIQDREDVRLQAEKQLAEQLLPYHIIVENFNIVNFDFSKEFNAAIEAKQVAQQQVETAKQSLAKAQVDAQTALAQAQGQANAQKALKDTGALSPEYLQWVFLQKWNGILPSVMGGANSFIDVSSFLKTSSP